MHWVFLTTATAITAGVPAAAVTATTRKSPHQDRRLNELENGRWGWQGNDARKGKGREERYKIRVYERNRSSSTDFLNFQSPRKG